MRRIYKLLILAISALIIGFGGASSFDKFISSKHAQDQLESLRRDFQRVENEKRQLEQDRAKYKKQIQEKNDNEKKLQEKIKGLQAAKKARENAGGRVYAAALPYTQSSGWHNDCRPQAARVKAAADQLGIVIYWNQISYILGHESCMDPGRENAGGCRGLGQACPGSKLPCGPDDVVCQLRYFDNYAKGKGGWPGAYAFWLSHNWW